MSTMIVINLPWIDTALLPNNANGRDWRATSSAKKAARMTAKDLTLEVVLGDRWIRISDSIRIDDDRSLHIIFFPPRNPGPDVDGVLSAMKPTLDGIAEALGINDRRFNPITITRGQVIKGGCVKVLIDELPFT